MKMNRMLSALTLGAAAALCAASSAQALTTFASYTEVPSAVTNIMWTNTGFSAGTLANFPADGSEAGVTDTSFNFLIGGLPTNLAADFTLSASSTSPALVAFGVLLVQPGISGAFSFTYDGPTQMIGTRLFAHGANLLSGTFTNAYIQGVMGGGTGSTNAEMNTLGPITFTSDFLTFGPDNKAIAIGLNSIFPPLHINGPGDSLASFTASSTGNFSADTVSITGGGTPEPASWALMLIGVGAVGFAVRSRAKVVSAAA